MPVGDRMPLLEFSAASVFLFCTAAFCAWLAAYALMQPGNAFTRNFVALMLVSTVYSLGYGVELAAPDLTLMKAALRLQYLGIPFLPLAWIGLAWSYLDPRGLPRVWWRTLLALSLALCFMHQSNDLHHLYYADLAYTRDGALSVARITAGPAYWLMIVYLDLASAVGVLLFVRAWRQSKPIYHRQALCLLTGSFFPWLFHLIYQLGLSPHGVDLGPFGLTAGGALFVIASFRHGVLDILPVARDLVFDGIAEGVIVVDERQRIVDFNRAASEFFAELDTRAIGCNGGDFARASVLASVLSTEGSGELPLAGEPPRHLEIRSHTMAMRGGKTIGRALLIRDISEKKALIEQLRKAAATDELTGVFNRRQLMELSTRAFQLAQRYRGRLAVMVIDVDHFKAVNDRRGHPAGDALLKRIAAILQTRLRATDVLGRYGGDEFIIALPETDAPQCAALAHALNAACREECGATLSIGVAQIDATQTDFNALLGQADEALYRAKRAGRNQVAVAGATTARNQPRATSSPLMQ